jgi:dethiobiotin synthetase
VVTTATLGTLNHTALTLEAIHRRGLRLAGGVVIGSWPTRPGLAEWCNVTDLTAITGRPLGGALPVGLPRRAGGSGLSRFTDRVSRSLGPEYGGGFDAEDFVVNAGNFVATARHGLDRGYVDDQAGGLHVATHQQ